MRTAATIGFLFACILCLLGSAMVEGYGSCQEIYDDGLGSGTPPDDGNYTIWRDQKSLNVSVYCEFRDGIGYQLMSHFAQRGPNTCMATPPDYYAYFINHPWINGTGLQDLILDADL